MQAERVQVGKKLYLVAKFDNAISEEAVEELAHDINVTLNQGFDEQNPPYICQMRYTLPAEEGPVFLGALSLVLPVPEKEDEAALAARAGLVLQAA